MASWKRLDDLSESDRHARVSFEAVGVWAYLIGTSDSCGRRSGDADILRKKVFTLRANATDAWITDRLGELSDAGLIHQYPVGGRRHLVMHRYGKYNPGAHLKVRPTFPAPPVGLCDPSCLLFHESEDPKLWRNYGPVGCGEVPSEGDSEGIGEPRGAVPAVVVADGSLGYLQSVARSQSILGAVQSVNTAVAGWRTRYGAEKCLEMLMNNGGKSWLEIDKIYAPQPNGKPKVVDTNPRPKPVKQANCKACDTTGIKMLKQTMKDGSRIDVATKCPECQ